MHLKSFRSPLGALLLVGSLGAAAGCGPTDDVPIGEVEGTSREGACSDKPCEPNDPTPDPLTEAELAAAVADIFSTKCAGCHGNSFSFGALDDILDVDTLRARNLINEAADTSVLFQLISSNHMAGAVDPTSRRPVAVPTPAELDYVRQWIDVGAPPLR